MNRISPSSSTELAEAVRRQPLTPAKAAFCWQLVVGPAVARATRVSVEGGHVLVSVGDRLWRREVERVLPLVRARLEALLGADVVAGLRVCERRSH